MAREHKTIILGGGCFWCLEAAYQSLRGVIEVIPGYAGGSTTDPSYESVCAGDGMHAEVVKIIFNPKIISLSDILDVFWAIHDPTSLNRQGSDVGVQYRSAIYYQDSDDDAVIDDSMAKLRDVWPLPITTEIRKLDDFYPAEEYHRNYFLNNPDKAYCQVVINPKLVKLREKFSQLQI